MLKHVDTEYCLPHQQTEHVAALRPSPTGEWLGNGERTQHGKQQDTGPRE